VSRDREWILVAGGFAALALVAAAWLAVDARPSGVEVAQVRIRRGVLEVRSP